MRRSLSVLSAALVALGLAALVGAGEPEKPKASPESITRRIFRGTDEERAKAAEEALTLGKEGMVRLFDLVHAQAPVYGRIEGNRIENLIFETADLATVTSLLGGKAHVRFDLSPAAKGERFAEIRVTLSMHDCSVRTVLSLVTDPNGLVWEPRDGGVWIGTAEEIAGH